MVSFTHRDAGTSEAGWAASGLPLLPELPFDAAELAGGAFVVLAAHPDDESLGAGGLMARLRALGADVSVLLCTAGESSHPESPTTTPDQLAAVRLNEFGGALGQLLPDSEWRYLALPDGKLASHREEIRAALQEATLAAGAVAGVPADGITLVAPYRHDGHTDHDVLGSVAAEVAAAGGHGLLEYPIWYWLWADPSDPAWQSWLRLPLNPGERKAKAAAMAAHASQVRALSRQPGDEVLLPPAFLAHFERTWETFAWQRPAARAAGASAASGGTYTADDAESVFDAVHAGSADPWQYTTSWYEHRKRSLTLAALPRPSYAAGLEIGCSIGTLSVELAQRCGRFLAVDASSAALAHAAPRLAHFPAAETRHLTIPQEWPEGRFDLVVVSEVGYYLAPDELAGLLARVEAALLPGGTLLLCHWRHAISGWELDGDSVHAAARRQLGWAVAGLYRERDFVLEVFTAPEPGTVAGAVPEGAR